MWRFLMAVVEELFADDYAAMIETTTMKETHHEADKANAQEENAANEEGRPQEEVTDLQQAN